MGGTPEHGVLGGRGRSRFTAFAALGESWVHTCSSICMSNTWFSRLSVRTTCVSHVPPQVFLSHQASERHCSSSWPTADPVPTRQCTKHCVAAYWTPHRRSSIPTTCLFCRATHHTAPRTGAGHSTYFVLCMSSRGHLPARPPLFRRKEFGSATECRACISTPAPQTADRETESGRHARLLTRRRNRDLFILCVFLAEPSVRCVL